MFERLSVVVVGSKPLPVFELGDRVNVTGGQHSGDYGTVTEGPFDLRPSHVWVDLQRAGESKYIPVWNLERRLYERKSP